MKSKGFTLIELLAVIVILAIIALIATPIILNIIDDTKKSSKERSKELYLDAANQAIVKYNINHPGEVFVPTICHIQVNGDLLCDGLKGEIPVEVNGQKPTSGDIIFSDGKIVSETISFDSSSQDKNTLASICEYDGTSIVEEKTIGAKYHYTVDGNGKNNHTFYVLITPNKEDTTINLIMDRNICQDGTPSTKENPCFVEWHVSNLDTDGPVTAMEYLHKSTENWINILPLNYIYKDRETQESEEGRGYVSFVSEKGKAEITSLKGDIVTIGSEIKPLRSRLPIYSTDVSKTEVEFENESNKYLFDYLNRDDNFGYWTLSTQTKYSSAWFVRYDGNIINVLVNFNDIIGVRPVITISLD